jgi:hypothetical protein
VSPNDPEVSREEHRAWLTSLLGAAEDQVADLRARDDRLQAPLIADLDDFCVRLRDEIAGVKPH